MKTWKVFVPDRQDLERLLKISPGKLFVSGTSTPTLESIYLLDQERGWVSLSWSYVDVEFKFEIYCVSIGSSKEDPADLIPVGEVPPFASVGFLLRSEWVRPANPGEVPGHFEQVKEESGAAESVPSSATSVGTSLYGIVFSDEDSRPLFAITVDDNKSYSLKVISAPKALANLVSVCDLCTFPQLMAWKPPAND